jgi:predicted enzyme related to lactoylglutathione lyase
MKIALVGIIVNNPVDAFKFYTNVLGFAEKMFIPEARMAIVAAKEDTAGTSLILEPNDNPLSKTFQEGLYKAGIPVMVFSVTDIQQEYERLKEAGVVFKEAPSKKEYGTTAILDDTCGNYIQLLQP